MKKIICILMSLFVCGITLADSNVCRVAGTTGEVAVMASPDNIEKGIILVEAQNDTDVTVSVRFNVRWCGRDKSGMILVQPRSSNTTRVYFGYDGRNHSGAYSPEIISVTGSKCK